MIYQLRFLLYLVIFCLTAARAPAQQAAPQKKPAAGAEHSDDRGVLLGVYFPEGASWEDMRFDTSDQKWVPDISKEPHGQYLTFWVSKSGGVVKIQATEGLLVPRASGFWHIGTQIVHSDQNPDSSYDEQFWALPAEENPKPPEADPQIDGRSVRLITYAGPEYVAYLFHWQGGAGAWEYVYTHVASVNDLATDASLEKVLGPAAGAGYKRLAKSLDHMSDEVKEGEDREPCNCCTSLENEWGILHAEQSWRAYARFHPGPSSSCSQGWEDHTLKAAMPKSVASGGTLNRTWDAVRAEVEAVLKSEQGSVRHLFVSPKQDLAVAVGRNGLAVLGVENLHISSVLKIQAFDRACIPVMEQWATGRFVPGWDAAIQKEHPAALPGGKQP
jgi:hypothetical protein